MPSERTAIKDHVCADCGHETEMKSGPCEKCGSYRIVLISFVEQHFGANWRSAFEEPVPDCGDK